MCESINYTHVIKKITVPHRTICLKILICSALRKTFHTQKYDLANNILSFFAIFEAISLFLQKIF